MSETFPALVELSQLQNELRRQKERLACVCAAQQEIALADPSPEVIWRIVAERARQVTGAEGAIVEMAEGGELVCCAKAGELGPPVAHRQGVASTFSSLAVRRDEVVACDDTLDDARPESVAWRLAGVRSLVSVPLTHQYNAIGVLTVLSVRPRAFEPNDSGVLQLLGYLMGTALNQAVVHGAKRALLAEHSRTIVALRESEQRFRSAFDSAPIGMALTGLDGSWIQVNRTLARILGRGEDELRSLTINALLHPEDLDEHMGNVRKLLSGVISVCQTELRFVHKTGSLVWASFSASLLRDPQGRPLYLISQIQDITERKRAEQQIQNSLREKEVLLKEIHHRVKNNLQVISSLLNLQSSYCADPKTNELFRESQNRVRSMALIHEKLYQSEDLGRINVEEYVLSLVSMLFRFYGTNPSMVRLESNMASVSLNLDTAIPVGLLIHELVSNSLKYAFPHQRLGTIQIDFERMDSGEFVLRFGDDGIGLPEEFDIDKAPSLGLRLVKILSAQLGGELTLRRGHGVQFTIRFRELSKA